MSRLALFILLLTACADDTIVDLADGGTRVPRFPNTGDGGAGGDGSDPGLKCELQATSEILVTVPGVIPDVLGFGDHLYFTVQDSTTTASRENKVARVPKSGGPVEVLAEREGQPFSIAADARGVYWSNLSIEPSLAAIRGLRMLPNGTDTPVTVWEGEARELAMGGGYLLVWTTTPQAYSELRRFQLPITPSSTSTVVASLPPTSPRDPSMLLRVTEEGAYWIQGQNGSTNDNALYRVGHNETSPTRLVELEDGHLAAANGQSVYFSGPTSAPGFYRQDLTPGPRQKLFDADVVGVGAAHTRVLLDAVGANLYLVSIVLSSSSVAIVHRIPIAGGLPCELLADEMFAAPFTVELYVQFEFAEDQMFYRRRLNQIVRVGR